MSTSPYQPPQSKVVDHRGEPASAVKSVLIALAVDLGGSMALGTVMAIVYAGMLVSQGLEPEQIAQAFADIPPTSMFSLIGIAGGVLISGIAGFVCAQLSRRRDYQLGFILAGIAGAFSLLTGYGSYSLAINAGLILLTSGAILLGMKLGMPKAGPTVA